MVKRGWWILKGLKFVVLVTVLIGVFGWVVMTLWNALLPELFGVHTVTYWQALGILLLSKLLFGGRPFGGGHSWKRRMHERWHQMTPEQRDKLRHGMRHHSWCHGPEDEAGSRPSDDRPA